MDDHKDGHVDSCATDIRKDHTTSDSAHEDNNIRVIDEHHVECVEEESHHGDIKTDSYEHRDIHVVSCATDTSKDHTASDSCEDDNNEHVIEEHLAECIAAELHHVDVKGDMDDHKDVHIDSCATVRKDHTTSDSAQEDKNIGVIHEHHVECVEEESHHEDIKTDSYEHRDIHVVSCATDTSKDHTPSDSGLDDNNGHVIEHLAECRAAELQRRC